MGLIVPALAWLYSGAWFVGFFVSAGVYLPAHALAGRSAMNFRIRRATPQDIPALNSLIEQSIRGLQGNDYTLAQREGAIGHTHSASIHN